MKNVFFLKVVLLLLLFSITHSSGMQVLAQQSFGSSATIGENQNTNINASNGLGTTSVVQEHFLREMRVTIRAEEQSYSRMQEGSAQVLENPSGSIWSAGEMVGGLFKPGTYAKTSSVLFRLWQRPNPAATKTYKPEFRGVVEFFGEGGGEKKDPYAWNVINADYEIKDIEIHRSVAGGPFVKISDEQNVEPVIVGQKIKLKVVINPSVSNLDFRWSINGGVPIRQYEPNQNSAEIIYLNDNDYNQKEITCFYTTKGTTNISVKITPWGSEESVTKNASYTILAPTVSNYKGILTTKTKPPAGCHGGNKISLGYPYSPQDYGISFSGNIVTPSDGSGHFGIVQLVNAVRINYYEVPQGSSEPIKRIITTEGQEVLDYLTSPSKEFMDGCVIGFKQIGSNDTKSIEHKDLPSHPINMSAKTHGMPMSYKARAQDSYKSYLVYKPSGGIWVPLSVVKWDWSATASEPDPATNCVDDVPGTASTPQTSDAQIPPMWKKNIEQIMALPVWSNF